MDIELTITEAAQATIRNMRQKCVDIATHVETDQNALDLVKTVTTLAQCLAEVMTHSGNGRVSSDGELDLLVSKEHYVFGVNWDPKSKSWSVNS